MFSPALGPTSPTSFFLQGHVDVANFCQLRGAVRRSPGLCQPGRCAQRERRQFTNSHDGLSPEARDLAQAIDSYKLMHRRRFITYEEMLAVVKSLGYKRD